jgi:hypothetical protein
MPDMRSPIGPILVLLGLGTTVVLVLLLVQTMGLRSDLDEARAEVAALQAQVDAQAAPMTVSELTRGLEELEAGIRDWLIATGADGGFDDDPSQPAGGSGTVDELLDRLDEVLERITALDRRVDEICESVPVC